MENTYFKNYAGVKDCDSDMERELKSAGIASLKLFSIQSGEVPTHIMGFINEAGWSFERAWTYWVAEGPGIPPKDAEKLHAKFGQVVRVAGHCGCPSPTEWYKGFGCGSYHIDTQEGLKALADTIKDILRRNE